MVEILRRVVLVVGVYGAILALCHARPVVVEVAVEDFAARQAGRPGWSGDRQKSLETFIADRTEGRVVEAGGADWQPLYDAIVRAHAGDGAAGRFAGREGHDRSEGSLYLLPCEAPLTSIEPPLGEGRPVVYARFLRPDGVAWLHITRRIGREARGAPAGLVRPLRAWWWAFLVGGLGLYIVLPRRRKGEDTLTYSTLRAGILPDFVGLLLGGTFFGLGLMIVPEITGSGSMFDPAAWPLYLVMGIFVLLAWVIHGWAAWYEAFRLDVGPDELHLHTLRDERRVAYGDIETARFEVRRAPKLLRRLMWVAAFFNTTAAGQAVLLSGRADAELILTETGGRRTRLRLTALEGSERVAAALEAAGVAIEDGTGEEA